MAFDRKETECRIRRSSRRDARTEGKGEKIRVYSFRIAFRPWMRVTSLFALGCGSPKVAKNISEISAIGFVAFFSRTRRYGHSSTVFRHSSTSRSFDDVIASVRSAEVRPNERKTVDAGTESHDCTVVDH